MKKKKDFKIEKLINPIIYALIIISIINMLIYIFAGCKGILNSDSAFIVDYSLEQIRTHSIIPTNWYNTNDFWIYSLIPFVTVFLKMGLSMFLSRQISVFIQTVLLFVLLHNLVSNVLDNKKSVKYIILLFISGISGQFMFEMFGDATYGSIVFYMLLEVWLLLRYMKTEKKYNIVLYSIILALLTGCSMRFPIFIGAPVICVLLYLLFDNIKNKKAIITFVLTLVSIVIGLVIFKVLSSNFELFTKTNRPILEGANIFAEATSTTLYNYFMICGASNVNVLTLTLEIKNSMLTCSSPLIVFLFVRYIFGVVTLALPFILFKKFKEFTEVEKILYIFITSFAFIMLFFLIFAGMYAWYRYITPVLFFLSLLYIYLFKYFFSDKTKTQIVYTIAMVLFALSSLFFVFFSYFDVLSGGMRKNAHEPLVKFLESKDLKYGYYNGPSESNIFRLISEGNIQINRISEGNKTTWLNSKDWYTEDYYDGRTFLIRNKIYEPYEWEKNAIEKYEYNDNEIIVFKNHRDILDNIN